MTNSVDDRTDAELQEPGTKWKAEKTKYAAQLTNKKISFSQGLGKLLETRRTEYLALQGKTNANRADFLPKLTALKSNSAKIDTAATAYLTKIKGLGDPAEKDLRAALTKIKTEAAFDKKLQKVVIAQTGTPTHQMNKPSQNDLLAEHAKWKIAKGHYDADLKAHKVNFNQDLGALLDKRQQLYKQYDDLTHSMAAADMAKNAAKIKTVLTGLKDNGKALEKAADDYLTKIKGVGGVAEPALHELLTKYKHDAQLDINNYTNAFQ
jgi:predicted flap endonuclease-1-like 5' DNA nuclease